jgi:hypothetical protein
MEKAAASYGEHAIAPAIIDRYVLPATPIQTDLQVLNLRHTRNGYTGARDPGGHNRVFTLQELVGKDSIWGFNLKRWDGM